MYLSRMTHFAALVVGLGALLLAACGNDPAPANANSNKIQCTLNSDCPAPQVCGADGFCATAFSGGDVAINSPDAGAPADGAVLIDGAGVADVPGTPGKAGFCSECTTQADCGAGWSCRILVNKGPGGSEHFCLPNCQTDSECQPGTTCTADDSAPQLKACVPLKWKCDGCFATPCAAGQMCLYADSSDINAPPMCTKAAAPCESCDQNQDCAPQNVCLDVDGNGKVCVPRCDAGQDCGNAATCQPTAGGIDACTWQADTCCFGASCQPTAACKGCPDTCLAGQCVQCTKDSHCTEGTCNLTAKPPTCVKSACPDGKQQDASGACVDCLNATHCLPNEVCVSGKCETQNQDNVCKLCQAPYPACVTIGGQPACVECATDDDCKTKDAGTCDAKTYTCSGTTQGGAPDKGECKTDQDCKDSAPPTAGFDLACDTGTGLCYDKQGYCDNITAFCNKKAGSTCKEQGGLGGLPGGGGIPGMGTPPGGAQPGSGVCSCGGAGNGTPAICKDLLGLKNCDCAKDPSGKDCDPFGAGTCCSLGCVDGLLGNNGPDPACFGGGKCMNMGCIFALMGGAGSGSSADSQGYCASGTP